MGYQKEPCHITVAVVTTVIVIILLLMGATAVFGATNTNDIPDSFFNALRQVEDGKGNRDGGQALGPYSIHRAYWVDSGVAGAYHQCKDAIYSRRVIRAYLVRYGSQYIARRDWKALARIHNGGPQGNNKGVTNDYGNRVVALMR